MITLGVLLLLLGSERDCEAGVYLKPQIDVSRLPKTVRLKEQGRRGDVFRETLEFPDGISLTVEVSGCLTVAVELRSRKHITSSLSPDAAIALMIKKLEALPSQTDARLRTGLLIDALNRLHPQQALLPIRLECGGKVSCELKLDITQETPVLVISAFTPLYR